MNKFDNKGNGVDIDGQIDFRADKTFTLWSEQGIWKALDETKFQLAFKSEIEIYQFKNYDPTQAICIVPVVAINPMRIVLNK